MKNLRGALPAIKEDDQKSSRKYFFNLGLFLMSIALVLSIGTFLLFLTAMSSTRSAYEAGWTTTSSSTFLFLIFMTFVILFTGMGLVAVSTRMKKK